MKNQVRKNIIKTIKKGGDKAHRIQLYIERLDKRFIKEFLLFHASENKTVRNNQLLN